MKFDKIIFTIFIIFFIIVLGNLQKHTHIKSKEIESDEKYIHISFDDVSFCIKNIVENNYESIWEEPFFGWIKSLKEKYDAKFSLYCYLDKNFENISNKYQKELKETSEWLKFGLHSKSDIQKYDLATYNEGFEDWETFVQKVIELTGNINSIDRVPRLHYYAGTSDALMGMRDATNGALGFLTADDDRNSYYLGETENDKLLTEDFIIEPNMKLYFYGTDMRGDWFKKDFSSNNYYDKPVINDVYEELERRYSDEKYKNDISCYIWFCHEWQLYDGSGLKNKWWIEDVCKFANDYEINFEYPQNGLY